MIRIHLDVAATGRTRWYEYALRFGFGGAITAGAGLVAKHWGPEVGGLFLAFPAIFPASATLIEKHEKEKKNKAGFDGRSRGRLAAGLDAAGAVLGSFGLMAFAIVVWSLIADRRTWLVLLCATFVWLLVSGTLWYLRKTKLGMRGLDWRRHHHKHSSPF